MGRETPEIPTGSVASPGSKRRQADENQWIKYKGLSVNSGLFNLGVLLLKTSTNGKDITSSSFSLGDSGARVLKVCHQKESTDSIPHATKQHQLFFPQSSAEGSRPQVYITNTKRREEVFVPSLISENEAIYVYPWCSESLDRNKNLAVKFKKIVTAGCLIGSALKAYWEADPTNATFPFIKHNVVFDPGKIIAGVVFSESDSNPYEAVVLRDFEKMLKFFAKHSKPDEQKEIVYHLPHYDYILFAIHLVMQGKMTVEALGQAIKIILSAKKRYEENLSKMLQDFITLKNTQLIIESPFDLLFEDISVDPAVDDQDPEGSSDLELAKQFLQACGIQDVVRSSNLVTICLQKLTKSGGDNQKAQMYPDIWSDICEERKLLDSGVPTSIEDLFTCANAVMVARASKNSAPYEVCAFYNVTEKQIQVGYSKFLWNESYAPVYNITVLDSVLAYSHSTNGNIFYLSEGLTALSSLIGSGVLETLSKNVYCSSYDSGLAQPTAFSSFIAPSAVNPSAQPIQSCDKSGEPVDQSKLIQRVAWWSLQNGERRAVYDDNFLLHAFSVMLQQQNNHAQRAALFALLTQSMPDTQVKSSPPHYDGTQPGASGSSVSLWSSCPENCVESAPTPSPTGASIPCRS